MQRGLGPGPSTLQPEPSHTRGPKGPGWGESWGRVVRASACLALNSPAGAKRVLSAGSEPQGPRVKGFRGQRPESQPAIQLKVAQERRLQAHRGDRFGWLRTRSTAGQLARLTGGFSQARMPLQQRPLSLASAEPACSRPSGIRLPALVAARSIRVPSQPRPSYRAIPACATRFPAVPGHRALVGRWACGRAAFGRHLALPSHGHAPQTSWPQASARLPARPSPKLT